MPYEEQKPMNEHPKHSSLPSLIIRWNNSPTCDDCQKPVANPCQRQVRGIPEVTLAKRKSISKPQI